MHLVVSPSVRLNFHDQSTSHISGWSANNLSTGWQTSLKDPLAALNPPVQAAFVPVWSSLNPSTAVSSNPVVDGIMTWKAW